MFENVKSAEFTIQPKLDNYTLDRNKRVASIIAEFKIRPDSKRGVRMNEPNIKYVKPSI